MIGLMIHQSDSRLRRISSRQNALVKDLRKALSQGEPTAEGYLAVEGVRMIEEAIRSGLRLQAVFFSEAGSAHATRRLPQIGSQNALVKDLRKALSQGEPTAEGY